MKTVKLWELIDQLYDDMNGQTTGITQWQRQACEFLGIHFVRPFQCQDGGPHVVLTKPDLRSLRSIGGDGNCLFRALCYIISGSQDQHMLTIPDLLSGTGPDGNRIT